ncbi:MAG: hypothetical protein ACPG4W_00975 [Flavobacteriales bacterium]
MKKNLHVLALLILIVPVSYVAYWIQAYQELSIEKDSLTIEGFIGETVSFSDIDTILSLTTLPRISESAGLTWEKNQKGYFTRFSDSKRVKLFAHHTDLYIKIVKHNGEIIYYNSDKFYKTEALIIKLQHALNQYKNA